MNSFENFLNNIILLGVIQGIITTILLFRIKANQKANKLLAWIILLISLACLNLFFLETLQNTSTLFEILEAIIPLVIIMPIGPLIYFYIKTILNPDFKINQSKRKHFYSTILDFAPNIVVVFYIILGFLGFINNTTFDLGNFIYYYNKFVDIPRWLSLTIYLWFTYKLISNHKSDVTNEVFTKWTKNFTLGFTIFSIIWFFHLVPYLIPSLSNILLSNLGWYPVYIPLIILVYWLGINGYIISFKTYKKNSKSLLINDEVVAKTIEILNNLMKDDKLYLNGSLQLKDIVKQTNIPQKTISAVLNQHFNSSFNEFVNTYRIEEFKKRLLSDNKEKFTITGIAFECGFNSQATFQRVFKANTKLSPSQFRKMHLKT
ncbi:AraC family transcriptional regulator [Polaribacter sp. Hel_I_88]|uniref:helix-turn-helix domain-containing protein n=1 Tax=Polaribacter sp. Hel_I_88 TaxID=1250006 RepID=UPI00056CCE8B|nr:helix-turn-helix domain-containing protein [Polaribacter sp. Hel_I_88]